MRNRGTTEARAAGLAAWLVVPVFFLVVGIYPIDGIGFYYDEVVFMPATLRMITGLDAYFDGQVLAGDIPLMLMPYLGGLKAILYGPIVYFFGITPAAVRIPALLLGLFTVLIASYYVSRRAGRLPGVLCLILLGTDPVFIFHAKIDWGPCVISAFCRIAALFAALRYVETKSPAALLTVGVFCAAGIWDKLNFVWFVAALAVTLFILEWRNIAHAIRRSPVSHALIFGIFAFAIGLVTAGLVFPALRLGLADPTIANLPVLDRFWRVLSLYKDTFSGVTQYEWMFYMPLGTGIPWRPVLIPQVMIGLVLLPLAWSKKREAKLAAVTLIILLIELFVMTLTKEVGGSHHLVFAWPLQHINAAMLLTMIWRAGKGNWITSLIVIAAAGVITAQNVRVSRAYVRAQLTQDSFNPRFDPAIGALAEHIDLKDHDSFVAIDWGLHNPLLLLVAEDKRLKLKDLWIPFRSLYGQNPAVDESLETNIFRGRRVTAYAFAPGKETFADTWEGFISRAAAWNLCYTGGSIISDSHGRALYNVYEFDDTIPKSECRQLERTPTQAHFSVPTGLDEGESRVDNPR